MRALLPLIVVIVLLLSVGGVGFMVYELATRSRRAAAALPARMAARAARVRERAERKARREAHWEAEPVYPSDGTTQALLQLVGYIGEERIVFRSETAGDPTRLEWEAAELMGNARHIADMRNRTRSVRGRTRHD